MSMHRILLVLALATLPQACGDDPASPNDTTAEHRATYVGRETCVRCHPTESGQYEGSHHDRAMEEVGADTVLGDFDGVSFEQRSLSAEFVRHNGAPCVRTAGADGKVRDFPVAYTFGVTPLQQYLIETDRGRYQALTIPWDSRPAEEGGQRWYSLYPDDDTPPGDPLHWTGTLQNWNYMCAECHSTDLRKNYDVATDSYDTTWSEIDVSCEACHGPASEHLRWAEAAATDSPIEDPNRGLQVILRPPWGDWEIPAGEPTAVRTKPLESRAELETCARCHSRRTQFAEEGPPGEPLGDAHLLSFLNQGLYHPDGQILDEVYVYGSFLQSKMHQQGVVCSDCHDPHSAKVLFPGNELCARCHQPEVFDTPEHHHHPVDSTGASCVECHMPARHYMVVDPRRDHSLRIPRPDLTVRTGSPNACNDCHQDQDAKWALDHVNEWYGPERAATPHFATALHGAWRGDPSALDGLRHWIQDPDTPGIVRATALTLLPIGAGPDDLAILRQCAEDADPLVRRAAADALLNQPVQVRMILGMALLEDPVRAVRMSAVLAFAEAPVEQLPPELRASFDRAVEEYREAQNFNADRPEGLINLGNLEVRLGRRAEAESAYRMAVDRHPWFLPAYVNLADLLRDLRRDRDGELVLRAALDVEPDNAFVHHSLGLLLIRLKRTDEALTHLERAVELMPANTRFAYVFAVGLYETGERERAVQELAQAHGRQPDDLEIVQALVSYHHEMEQRGEAGYWARKLRSMQPGNPELERWLGEMGL